MSTVLTPDGHLGCLPRTTLLGADFPVSTDVIQKIPRSDWRELIPAIPSLEPFEEGIKDQNGENSCSSNAATGAGEVSLNYSGYDAVPLSQAFLYRRVNNGRDQGSGIDANLREFAARGTLPVTGTSGFAHTYPAVGWRTPVPTGWEETASKFKAEEWFDIPDFDAFMTALLLNFPICYGVIWGGGGHAILGIKAIWKNNQFGCRFANSWGVSWSGDGHDDMYEAQISQGIRIYGAWALRAMTAPVELLKAA